ncbi:TetR/AcrR family transcriptional regulator [Roseisolibacter agri]|nr:TetR/AcrR family transcriptional regulator [Roseisolibacter agri]
MTTQRAPRKYEQKRRAEQQAETRRRIVEAMVALHAEVGPARTTISAIAERAGVERLTVYRHFGDETAMFEACSSHFASEVVSPPDPAAWVGIEDAAERLHAALRAFYAYYRRAERMLTHVHRDLPTLPALAAVMAPWDAFVADVRDGVVAAWAREGLDGAAARARLAAVVAHALRFETWRSLAGTGAVDAAIGDADVAELMVALARAAAAPADVPAVRG